jgi:cell division protein FtsW
MRRTDVQPIDRLLLWLVAGLAVFGAVILLSASGPISFQAYSDPLYFVRRQILFGIIPGAILFYLCSRIDVRVIERLAVPAFSATILLLLVVFIPGIGHAVGGSRSWVRVFGVQFQPSEFAKLTFLIYISAWLAVRGANAKMTLEHAISYFGALGLTVLLLVLEPDTGTMAVIAGTAMLLYLTAGAPLIWFATVSGVFVSLFLVLVSVAPYRAARVMTFIHPELDPKGIGYHVNQAILAVGSGGLFGLGYGQSRQKYLYLPEAQGDSVFAVMAEELGFAAILVFLAAIGCLVWRCFDIAHRTDDRFSKLFAAGVGIWIGVQTVINIASMIGLMPMTGVTLPFVSYGNSSMVSMMAALGLVASIGKRARTATV